MYKKITIFILSLFCSFLLISTTTNDELGSLSNNSIEVGDKENDTPNEENADIEHDENKDENMILPQDICPPKDCWG